MRISKTESGGGAGEKIVIGILAHVDAGKTTLAEGILYTCGNIRSLGRVDHGNAFLDNFALERDRGITIFSKQAQLEWQGMEITLLDTPGHTDFSAEMERTLQVLDYAVLVINGADGVKGHVETLWRLLKGYGIPVFLFVNKMDQDGTDQEELLSQLQSCLDENCIMFGGICGEEQGKTVFWNPCAGLQNLESIALCGEDLMEEYLETGTLKDASIAEAIADRRVFPCYFGSALKLWGVEMLLEGLRNFCLVPEYPERFGARVFKITRDETGNRLTHLKVTGGTLRVKQALSNARPDGQDIGSETPEKIWEEKVDQIRIYHGAGYGTAAEVKAGGVCAVTGLKSTFAGQGLGVETQDSIPVLEPILIYRLLLPESSDAVQVLAQLRQLEEEEPELHIVWKEEIQEIHMHVMGEVQTEILRSQIKERFGLDVAFGTGGIVYKETIAGPVEGIGHFEPLRHYAEVHLLLEPGERGSGLQFASLCSEDVLAGNWQRLILSQLEDKVHAGVLTGSEITDMRILLTAGKAHEKHTEGGDFRQAACRALRQGLRRGESVLLEPVFSFTMELPAGCVGRAMSDIQKMHGFFNAPVTEGENYILTGSAPAASMGDYQRELVSYTGGRGRLSCTLKGYEPCHNAEEVIAGMQYDPEGDIANPTGSVFCAHGAGFVVDWDRVEEYAHVQPAHLDNRVRLKGDVQDQKEKGLSGVSRPGGASGDASSYASGYITQEEIEEIFARTYGSKKEDGNRFRRYRKKKPESMTGYNGRADRGTGCGAAYGNDVNGRPGGKARSEELVKKEDYLLVDGYNIIFAWNELKELSRINIDSARDRLIDIMSNYQGYVGNKLILVFDAYKVKGNPGTVLRYHNIQVVYTREAETADQYIEKAVHELARDYNVTVATSDRLEQMISWGSGAMRMSARELKEAVDALHP